MGIYPELLSSSRIKRIGLIAPESNAGATDPDCGYNELRLKDHLMKMVWGFGLACIFPAAQRRAGVAENGEAWELRKSSGEKESKSSEHNKAWLLAESGGCRAELSTVEPHSVHSSFRFSICSQVELEAMNADALNPATVLMVNLDNGLSELSVNEQKWSRIESLEKSISPVANSLFRLSYGQIVAATRNFSKGM